MLPHGKPISPHLLVGALEPSLSQKGEAIIVALPCFNISSMLSSTVLNGQCFVFARKQLLPVPRGVVRFFVAACKGFCSLQCASCHIIDLWFAFSVHGEVQMLGHRVGGEEPQIGP